MKRVASAVAALGALTFVGTPVLAKTTLADFRGGGESLQRLLAQVHKKKVKVVVERAGEGSNSTSSDTTPTITPIGTSDSSIDAK